MLLWIEESRFVSFAPYTDIGDGEDICKLPLPNEDEYIPFTIPQDEQFVDNVCHVLFGKCFVNKTLEELVANDFKTIEEQEVENSLAEARKANRIAWWAVGITALVGICQIILGIYQIVKLNP